MKGRGLRRFAAKVTVALLCFSAHQVLSALDREAFTFTDYKLQIRIEPARQFLGANGAITLRNDSNTAQRVAVLQISSTLEWKSITQEKRPVQYLTQTFTSDIDHTGALSEAVVTLLRAVPPKGSAELQIAYEGVILPDSTRLERIGTPKNIAAANDWDRISENFTALRGMGYVEWYPVAMEAVSLTESDQFFEMLGQWKRRHSASSMTANLSIVGSSTIGPPVAVTNTDCSTASSEAGRTFAATTSCKWKSIGPCQPVIVAANYKLLERPVARVFYFSGSEAAASDYASVAATAAPLVREWLGEIRRPIVITELPESSAPFEAGTLYLTPLSATETKTLEVFLTHQLTHAALSSPRDWMAEGVANFMQAMQRERQNGRAAAIAFMQRQLPPLIKLEKSSLPLASPQPNGTGPPASNAATSLIGTTDPLLASTKGMIVWWMLRDMLGDRTLQNAFLKYRPGDDKEPSYMQRLLETEARITAPQETNLLEQFFDDWVYRDRGLPDFRIVSVYPRQMLQSGFLLTVTVENLGGAGAEVPVTAFAKDENATRRVWVPAKQKATVRIPLRSQPLEAQVNDGSVPETEMTNKTYKVKLEDSH